MNAQEVIRRGPLDVHDWLRWGKPAFPVAGRIDLGIAAPAASALDPVRGAIVGTVRRTVEELAR